MSEWKMHPRFENYFFSSDGEVFRIRNHKRITLIGTKCGPGYRAIDFRKNCRPAGREYIHRVVCELFNGAPEEGMQCRHLDGDKTNNKASNLCWGTAIENASDKVLHGTSGIGEKNPMAVLTRSKVDEMKAIRRESKAPYYKIAEQFGVSTMTAFRAVTGRAWQ